MTTTADPPAGTTLAATTSCPAGKVLLGGGARVFVSGGLNGTTVDATSTKVELRSSYPTKKHTWRAVGEVVEPLAPGETMTLQPYVLCGS